MQSKHTLNLSATKQSYRTATSIKEKEAILTNFLSNQLFPQAGKGVVVRLLPYNRYKPIPLEVSTNGQVIGTVSLINFNNDQQPEIAFSSLAVEEMVVNKQFFETVKNSVSTPPTPNPKAEIALFKMQLESVQFQVDKAYPTDKNVASYDIDKNRTLRDHKTIKELLTKMQQNPSCHEMCLFDPNDLKSGMVKNPLYEGVRGGCITSFGVIFTILGLVLLMGMGDILFSHGFGLVSTFALFGVAAGLTVAAFLTSIFGCCMVAQACDSKAVVAGEIAKLQEKAAKLSPAAVQILKEGPKVEDKSVENEAEPMASDNFKPPVFSEPRSAFGPSHTVISNCDPTQNTLSGQ